jgi:hypothetical protein
LLVRQAATAWHQGFAAARGELAKAFVPDLTKVGPEGYIHGYICVRPPCGEKPGHIKADDLAVAKDGGIVHRKTGWAVGHVARDENGLFVAHHANGDQTSHDSRGAALRSVSRRYNRRANQAGARPADQAAPGPMHTPAARKPEPGPVAGTWRSEKPAGEGHEETAKRLAAAFRSGEPTVKTPSTEGMQAYTTIETFPDGSKWVHKEYPSGTHNPITEKVSKANAIRDLLASRVADAVGAGAPHIVRTSPREVYMPFVGDATPGAEAPTGSLTKAMSTPAGARIGVFDAITGHQDRHSGNVLIASDGTPVPIDNNGTWEALADDGTGWLGNTSPFTDHLLEELDDGNTPISSAGLDAITARVEAIKPAFDQAARELNALNDDDDTEYATDLFPEEMFDQTMGALTRLRDRVADAENEAAA